MWKIHLKCLKKFELPKVFPEKWNFIKTKYSSKFYETPCLVIRSITIHFIFAINKLYNATVVQ